MKEQKDFYKVTMFFPLPYNDGDLFDESTWRWWLDEITQIVAGFTDLGLVAGWWHGHTDQNRWILAVVRTRMEVGQLRNFLRRARLWFRQDAMYFEWHPIRFELVK